MIRVAQLVYDCIPNAGSDPGIGWHAVVAASGASIEVHALTKSSNRQAIEAVDSLPNVTWHFLDVPEKLGPLHTGRSVGDALHLMRWLRSARSLCTALAERGEIDLTHFLTFSAFWIPVPFADVPVPHVFGPVGGGERIPAELESSWRDRLSAMTRQAIQTSFTRAPAWQKLVRSRGTVVVSAGSATTRRLESLGATVFETWRTGCVTDEMIDQLDEIDPIRVPGTTIVVSGRQLRWKGHDLAIDAMPVVLRSHPTARLELLGSGAEHENLKTRAAAIGVSDNVTFRRGVSREEERRRIAGADCFLLPSRRDAGSTLVPLAQVLRVPIAAFGTGALPEATGGFAYLADPAAHGSPSQSLAAAISDSLSASPERLAQGRRHAIERNGEASAQEALLRWYDYALTAD